MFRRTLPPLGNGSQARAEFRRGDWSPPRERSRKEEVFDESCLVATPDREEGCAGHGYSIQEQIK
jgi:hypothetical protein